MSIIAGLVEYTKEARKAWAINHKHKVSAVARYVVVMVPRARLDATTQIEQAIPSMPRKYKKIYVIVRTPGQRDGNLYYVNRVPKTPGGPRVVHINPINLAHERLAGKFGIASFNDLICARGTAMSPTFKEPKRLTEDTLISWSTTEGRVLDNIITFADLDAALGDAMFPVGSRSINNNPLYRPSESVDDRTPLLLQRRNSGPQVPDHPEDVYEAIDGIFPPSDDNQNMARIWQIVQGRPNSIYEPTPASVRMENPAYERGSPAIPVDGTYDHLSNVGRVERAHSASPTVAAASNGAAAAPNPPAVPPARSTNPYANYRVGGFAWNEGDFVIDLDRHVAEQSSNPQTAQDYLHIGLYGCQGVNHFVYGMPARRFGRLDSWFPSTIGARLSRKREACACGTDDLTSGRLTAEQVERIIPNCNFNLGDSFYHYGVTDPRSPLFKTSFSHLFRHVPSWCVLGNHDYNIHGNMFKFTSLHPLTDRADRPIYQVEHSYLTDARTAGVKPGCTDEQDQWNMPYRYYALVSAKTKTVFFCIDSNMFIFDLVQQQWLTDIYAKITENFSTFKKILVSHHPFEYYSTKRAPKLGKSEWEKYERFAEKRKDLSEKPKLLIRGNTETNFPLPRFNTIGKLLKYFVGQNNLRFVALFAAHDHLLAYHKIPMAYEAPLTVLRPQTPPAPGLDPESSIVQFISAGGGAQIHKVNRNNIYAEFPNAQFSVPKSGKMASYAFVDLVTVGGVELPADATVQGVPARYVYALQASGGIDSSFQLYFYQNFQGRAGVPQLIKTFYGNNIDDFRRELLQRVQLASGAPAASGKLQMTILNSKQLQLMRYHCRQSNEFSPYIAETWGYMMAHITETSVNVDLWEYREAAGGFVSTDFEAMPGGVRPDWRGPRLLSEHPPTPQQRIVPRSESPEEHVYQAPRGTSVLLNNGIEGSQTVEYAEVGAEARQSPGNGESGGYEVLTNVNAPPAAPLQPSSTDYVQPNPRLAIYSNVGGGFVDPTPNIDGRAAAASPDLNETGAAAPEDDLNSIPLRRLSGEQGQPVPENRDSTISEDRL